MATLFGVVSQVVGQVYAIGSNGVRRPLTEGDRLYVGEQIDTGADGAVSVAMRNGRELTLGRDSLMRLEPQMLGADGDGGSHVVAAPTDAQLTDVQRLQAAIEAGEDPTQIQEAPAAGGNQGGGNAAGGGISFVMLDAVGGALDPEIGFPTEGLGFTPLYPEIERGGDDDGRRRPGEPVDGIPQAGWATADGVDEDGLPGGISGGPNDAPGEATVVSGSLGYSFGSDGVGSFTWSTAGLADLGVTSGGVPLTYQVSADGLTLTAYAGSEPVFTLTVTNIATGAYEFKLLGALDHAAPPPGQSDENDLDFAFGYRITDGNGSVADGGLNVRINDDSPELAGSDGNRPSVGGLVHEDALPGGNREDAGQTTELRGDAGALDVLVNFGADGRGSFALNTDPDALADLQALGLTSGGQALEFSVSSDGTTLTAMAGGDAVFTLKVNPDGSYQFSLLKALDHPRADGDDSETLGQSGKVLDFSKLLTATDGDGDAVVGGFPPGSFTVDVQDDTPEAALEHSLTVTYQSGDPGFFNSYGYYIKDADGNPVSGEIIWGNTRFLAEGTSVTLDGLDPDSVGFFVIPNGAFEGLANGTEVTFRQVDGKWQGFVGDRPINGAGGAPALFDNPALNPSGSEHMQGGADGQQNWEDVNDGNSDQDFNDVVIKTEWSVTGAIRGTVHEDALTNPHAGNAEGGQTVTFGTATGAGSLASMVKFGADGPGQFGLMDANEASAALDAQGLTSGGQPLTYTVQEQFVGGELVSTTLTATAQGGYPVFSLTVNADGSFEFTLQGPLDHPNANGDDSELLGSGGSSGIDFSALLKVTDGDGDPVNLGNGGQGGLLVIDIEDDVPTVQVAANDQAVQSLQLVLDETRGPQDRLAANDAPGDYRDTSGPGYLSQATSQLVGGVQALFTLAGSAGADGLASQTNTFAFTGVPAEGLATTLEAIDGGAIRLVLADGGQVVNGVDATGDTVFAIRLVEVDGQVQLQTTLFEALRHPDNDQRFDEALELRLPEGALQLSYTVTRTDMDGDSASHNANVTLAGSDRSVISFQDDGPQAGTVKLDGAANDEAHPGGNRGGDGDAGGLNTTFAGTLVFDAGADGLDRIEMVGPDRVGVEDVTSTWDAATGVLSISSDRGELVRVTLRDPATGRFDIEVLQALRHEPGQGENDLTLQIGYRVFDRDGDMALGTVEATVNDDTPMIQALQPSFSSKAVFESTDAGFASSYGYYHKDADGNPVSGKIIWANVKQISAGTEASLDGLDPAEIGFFIIPHGSANAISNGSDVTFAQDANGVWQGYVNGQLLRGQGGGNVLFDQGRLNASGAHVQDNATPGNQNWEDVASSSDFDYDDINTSVTWGIGLQVNESALGTPLTQSFAGAFNVQFGADGEGALTYALKVGNANTALVDVQSGQQIVLVVTADGVEGRTAGSGERVFALSVDAGGTVTMVQDRAIAHPSADPSESIRLPAGALMLEATVTDGDGDQASAAIDLGQVVGFGDDAPTANDDTLVNAAALNANAQVVGHIDDLLANDRIGADGLADTPIRILGNGSQGGQLSVDASGNLIYTAGASARVGDEQFTYQLSDGDGDISTARLTIRLVDPAARRVEARNDAAVVTAVAAGLLAEGVAAQVQTAENADSPAHASAPADAPEANVPTPAALADAEQGGDEVAMQVAPAALARSAAPVDVQATVPETTPTLQAAAPTLIEAPQVPVMGNQPAEPSAREAAGSSPAPAQGDTVQPAVVGNLLGEGAEGDILLPGVDGRVLVGTEGQDVFVWTAEHAEAAQQDVVQAFGAEDTLDLSQLLSGIGEGADANVLAEYLSFDFTSQPGSTVINVTLPGEGNAMVEHSIVLADTIVGGGPSSSAADIIDSMLSSQQLVV